MIIDEEPFYVKNAAEVVAMIEKGATAQAVAAHFGMSPHVIVAAYRYGKHGIRSEGTEPALNQYNPPVIPGAHKRFADQVAEMRHEQALDFVEIGRRLGIHPCVASSAHRWYHTLHPDKPGEVPWQCICGHVGGAQSGRWAER